MKSGQNTYSWGQGLTGRALCNLATEGDRHRFAIGSNSAQAPNEVHIVSFCEEASRIDCEHKFRLDEIDNDGETDFENLTSQSN